MKLNKFNKLLKEEYENTFKDVDIKIENKKRSIHKILIPVYSFVALILIALLAIGIDVVSVNNYNSGVDKFVSDYNEGLQSLSSDELLNVKTKSNFDNIIKKYNLEKKTAFINSFNSSFGIISSLNDRIDLRILMKSKISFGSFIFSEISELKIEIAFDEQID